MHPRFGRRLVLIRSGEVQDVSEGRPWLLLLLLLLLPMLSHAWWWGHKDKGLHKLDQRYRENPIGRTTVKEVA